MSSELSGYEILLGVSGGIAAYKSAALCSLLVKSGAGVTVVMTEHAQRFVGAVTFGTLSGRMVYRDLFEAERLYEAGHISLTERADLIVVAPATANIMAKMACGLCDDLLSTVMCAAESDVLLAPAMNQRMWENPATQGNVERLKHWGCHFVGPESGRLACGETGIGRMSEPETILERIGELLAGQRPKAPAS